MLEAECSRVGTEICNLTTNYIAGNLRITQKNPIHIPTQSQEYAYFTN